MTRESEAELVSLAQDKGCAILLTDDPEDFLLRLAHTYRLELGCLVVGITGSIGKTTTKDVLAAVLAKRYRVWATKGNFNNMSACRSRCFPLRPIPRSWCSRWA